MESMPSKKKKSFGTHDGVFHADEVTACALLVIADYVDCNFIVRSRNPVELSCCEFICDVGGIYDPQRLLFDHHQADYQEIQSSAGMILRYLYQQGFFNQGEFEHLRDVLVLGIDLHDNGRSPTEFEGFCLFSHVISNFNPIDHNADDHARLKAFLLALDFTIGHIQRLLDRYRYVQSCKAMVAQKMEEGGCVLVFDKSIPWLESFFELGGESHEACFVIMPSGEHWKLRAIPPNWKERMGVRIPLPKSWAGLLEKELEQESGIQGAIFCHKERFTSVWKSKESAFKGLDKLLEMRKGVNNG